MSVHKESELQGSFRVDLVNPHQIYATLRKSLPVFTRPDGVSAWDTLKVEPVTSAGDALSDTFFKDGILFTQESTSIELEYIDRHPSYQFTSHLVINHNERMNPPHGFYSPERVLHIQNILEGSGEKVEFRDHDYSSHLVLDVSNNSYLEVDFGFNGVDDLARFHRNLLESQSTQEGRKTTIKAIIDLLEEGVVNAGIDLSLVGRNGRAEQPLKFGDEQDFLENARLYVQKYEAVMRALHQERQVPLPSTPIILRPPKDSILWV